LYAHAQASDPHLRGLVQGLATSPVLAEVLIRELDRALVPLGLVRRWADDTMLISAGRGEPSEMIGLVEAACAVVGAEHGLRLEPHGFQSAVYGPGGFESAVDFLNLRFSGGSVHVAPKKRAAIERTLAEVAVHDPDHALSYIRSIRDHYAPILSADGLDDLASILSADRRLKLTSPTPLFPRREVGHIPSAAEPSGSDGSLPAGAQDTRASNGEREANAPADASRSPEKGAARRYVEILRDLDAIDRDHLGPTVVRGPDRFRPRHFWLTEEVKQSRGALAVTDPGQYQIVEQALVRAAEISGSDRDGENLTMICTDFLATNDFGRPGDPAARARYLVRLATALGVRIVAVDGKTNELVFGDPWFATDADERPAAPAGPAETH
jgi:hypothetical protein